MREYNIEQILEEIKTERNFTNAAHSKLASLNEEFDNCLQQKARQIFQSLVKFAPHLREQIDLAYDLGGEDYLVCYDGTPTKIFSATKILSKEMWRTRRRDLTYNIKINEKLNYYKKIEINLIRKHTYYDNSPFDVMLIPKPIQKGYKLPEETDELIGAIKARYPLETNIIAFLESVASVPKLTLNAVRNLKTHYNPEINSKSEYLSQLKAIK